MDSQKIHHQLLEDLVPVKPVKASRKKVWMALVTLSLTLSIAAYLGIRQDWQSQLQNNQYLIPLFALLFGGMVATAFSVAQSIPAQHGPLKTWGVSLTGLVFYACTMLFYSGHFSGSPLGMPMMWGGALACTAFILGVAFLMGGLILWWLSDLCPQSPVVVASAVVFASILMGSMLQQLHCMMDGSAHRLFGHFLIPIVAGLIAVIPVVRVFRLLLQSRARRRTKITLPKLY